MTKPCLLSAERLKEIGKSLERRDTITEDQFHAYKCEIEQQVRDLFGHIAASSAPIGDGEIEQAIKTLTDLSALPIPPGVLRVDFALFASLLRHLQTKLGEVEKERDAMADVVSAAELLNRYAVERAQNRADSDPLYRDHMYGEARALDEAFQRLYDLRREQVAALRKQTEGK